MSMVPTGALLDYLESLTSEQFDEWIKRMGGPHFERLSPAATQKDHDEDKEGTYR